MVAVAAILGGCTTANGPVGSIPDAPFTTLSGSAMPTTPAVPMQTLGDARIVPAGYISFCLRFPDQCRIDPKAPTTVALDTNVMAAARGREFEGQRRDLA